MGAQRGDRGLELGRGKEERREGMFVRCGRVEGKKESRVGGGRMQKMEEGSREKGKVTGRFFVVLGRMEGSRFKGEG